MAYQPLMGYFLPNPVFGFMAVLLILSCCHLISSGTPKLLDLVMKEADTQTYLCLVFPLYLDINFFLDPVLLKVAMSPLSFQRGRETSYRRASVVKTEELG